jgi:hypothetical protein
MVATTLRWPIISASASAVCPRRSGIHSLLRRRRRRTTTRARIHTRDRSSDDSTLASARRHTQRHAEGCKGAYNHQGRDRRTPAVIELRGKDGEAHPQRDSEAQVAQKAKRRHTEMHREGTRGTQRCTEVHEGTQRHSSTERQRDKERHRETQRYAEVHRGIEVQRHRERQIAGRGLLCTRTSQSPYHCGVTSHGSQVQGRVAARGQHIQLCLAVDEQCDNREHACSARAVQCRPAQRSNVQRQRRTHQDQHTCTQGR